MIKDLTTTIILSESFVALTRRNYIVRRYNLSRTEYELLRAIKEGLTMGKAIERAVSTTNAAVDHLAVDLKLWFRNWTAEGFFQSVGTFNNHQQYDYK